MDIILFHNCKRSLLAGLLKWQKFDLQRTACLAWRVFANRRKIALIVASYNLIKEAAWRLAPWRDGRLGQWRCLCCLPSRDTFWLNEASCQHDAGICTWEQNVATINESGRRSGIGIAMSPFTIIVHSVSRWQHLILCIVRIASDFCTLHDKCVISVQTSVPVNPVAQGRILVHAST